MNPTQRELELEIEIIREAERMQKQDPKLPLFYHIAGLINRYELSYQTEMVPIARSLHDQYRKKFTVKGDI